ncbi:MAG: hypothetical protein J7502_12470 [Flavisolibacter sp.]|nr:hypothetical protein [Flavisolibacter sp.]
MKRLSIVIFAFVIVLKTSAQLVVIFQQPPSGLTYKPQLWNMMLSNTTNAPITLHIEVTLTPVNSSAQVLTGVTRSISLRPGTTLINTGILIPIQYNVLSSAYTVDANPVGLLPIGHFEACYHFFRHLSESIEQIAEQCQEITVGPLSPPELVYPWDQTSIEETNPQFTWLPPVPTNMFTNLKYDLKLVEINQNQSAADAIEQNIPVYLGTNLSSTTLLYPLSAATLEYNKHYSWRIVAKNNGNEVGASEIWEFDLKHFGTLQNTTSTQQAFVEFKKDPETAYAVFANDIKFSYQNETSDSIWSLKVYDLSLNRNEGNIPLDTIPLRRGQNLINYDATQNSFFVDRHFYQMEIQNSRSEVWRIRFEYRKSETANN